MEAGNEIPETVGHHYQICHCPYPHQSNNPTPNKTAAIKAFEVRSILLFIETTFCVDALGKSAIGDLEDPKLICKLPEQRDSTRKAGLQGVLQEELQLMK